MSVEENSGTFYHSYHPYMARMLTSEMLKLYVIDSYNDLLNNTQGVIFYNQNFLRYECDFR